MKYTLTDEDLKRAIKALSRPLLPEDYFDVKCRGFYESKLCYAIWGFNPTKEELDTAEKAENGYLTNRYGWKLYLSKKISTE
jgi:hypothetical protein